MCVDRFPIELCSVADVRVAMINILDVRRRANNTLPSYSCRTDFADVVATV